MQVGHGWGATRFTQGERVTGLLAPVIVATGKLDELSKGYVRMNEDLKKEAEGR